MYSKDPIARAMGFPIRTSTDQSLLAAPHGFSQPVTSFIASQCQGIHKMLFSFLTLFFPEDSHQMLPSVSYPLSSIEISHRNRLLLLNVSSPRLPARLSTAALP